MADSSIPQVTPQLGQTTYYKGNVNGNDFYQALPYGGNNPPGYTPISQQDYMGGLQGKIQQAHDFVTKSSQPGYTPQAGVTYTAQDVANFQKQLSDVQTGQGIHAPGYITPGINLGGNTNPGGMSFVTPQQQADAAKTQLVNPNPNATAANYTNPSDNNISQNYQSAFTAAKEAGTTAPTNATGANDMFSKFLTSSAVSSDPFINDAISAYNNYTSTQSQQKSLADTFDALMQSSGLQGINTQLIDMKKVMDGSEQDIRTEITKAGGFATNSQVLALTTARNKQNLLDYNNLLQTQKNLQDYVDKTMTFTEQDRTAATNMLNTQLAFDEKMQTMTDTMQKNAVDTIDRNVKAMGWDGIYQAAQSDPNLVSQIEKTYGMPAGGLAIAASEATQAKTLAQNKPISVTGGNTLYDPNTGQPIYTAPKAVTAKGSSGVSKTAGGSSGAGSNSNAGGVDLSTLQSNLSDYNGTKYVTAANLQGLDAKTKNAVTTSLINAGYQILDAKSSAAIDTIKGAQADLQNLSKAINDPNLNLPKTWFGQPIQYANATLNQVSQTNPTLASYKTQLLAVLPTISALKGVGSGGGGAARLFSTIGSLFPQATDTLPTAQKKLDTIYSLLDNGAKGIIGTSSKASSSQYTVGQTATNSKTGQTATWNGTSWVTK